MVFTLWLTGLPSSGKTTIAKELCKLIEAIHLDGNIIRKSLSKDLKFSLKDREENIRRVSSVCKVLNNSGYNVIASFVSPTEKIREIAKTNISPYPFVLVYVKCSVEECEKRDLKGLYQKAKKGEIKDFTGVSSPFEEPKNPDLEVDTEKDELDEPVNKILRFLEKKALITLRRTMFIGRFSPPHKGHKYLFDSVLNNGGSIVIAIRDTPLSKENPLTAEERKVLIEKLYPNNPRVKVIVIPDISEVCIGRKVGYRIMEVPERIRIISATKIRKGKLSDIPKEIRKEVKEILEKRWKRNFF